MRISGAAQRRVPGGKDLNAPSCDSRLCPKSVNLALGLSESSIVGQLVTYTSDLGLRNSKENSYQHQSSNMSGLDVAAGVTGLIVFSLKSLKTCLAGMDLISQARDFATYADRHRAQVQQSFFLINGHPAFYTKTRCFQLCKIYTSRYQNILKFYIY